MKLLCNSISPQNVTKYDDKNNALDDDDDVLVLVTKSN